MIDPVLQMLTDAYARRGDAGAQLRRAELSEARNHVLSVGPGPEAITPAYLLRSMRPGMDRTNEALVMLTDPAYRKAKRDAAVGDAAERYWARRKLEAAGAPRVEYR